MLGHKLYQVLRDRCEVHATFRRFDTRLAGIFRPSDVIDGVDAWDMASVRRAVSDTRPDSVVNCIGLIKQVDDARNLKESIYVNALFPHLVSECAGDIGARLIHVSTDCVFSGKSGDYSEEDSSDAVDVYGKAKYLGEVRYDHALTLRTSIVGRALFRDVSLIEWFLSQSGKRIKGYTNAIYTGLSTEALSSEIWRIVSEYPLMHGLYHLSSDKITKFSLLTLVNQFFKANVTIEPFDGVFCDRSLRSDRYRRETGFVPSSWEGMVAEMANDATPYGQFRRARANEAGGAPTGLTTGRNHGT